MENTKLDNGQDSMVWEQDLEFPYFINKNGQTGWIVDFLDRFYRNVFEMNINMLNNKNRREFPIAYCKTQAIPMFVQAFAQTLGKFDAHCLGRVETESKTQSGKKSKEDLWYYIDEQYEGQEVGNVLVYLDLPKEPLDLNNFKSSPLTLAEQNPDKKCRFKIDIFNIRVCYHYDKEPENLFSSDFFDKKVWSRIKPPHENFIYSVMDLRPSIHTRKEHQQNLKNLADMIKANPQQIFLERGDNYSDKSSADLSKKFLPFMVSVAVIEECEDDDNASL